MWLQKLHETVLFADYTAWYYLNVVWRSTFLDALVPYLRNQWTWAPLYLFLLVFMLSNFRRRGFLWCLFFLITFAISDQLSAHLLKPMFLRLRPCNNPMLAGLVHTIVPCGGGFSFPSSHAANHFALAVFMATTLGYMHKLVRWLALLWALLVAYAQVYVGVHFPLDVTVGGLLGIVVGFTTGKIFHIRFPLYAVGQADPDLSS